MKTYTTGREYSSLPFSARNVGSPFRTRPIDEVPVTAALARNPTPAIAGKPPSTSQGTGSPTDAVFAQPAIQGPTGAVVVRPPKRGLPRWGEIGDDEIVTNADGHRLDLPLPIKSEWAVASLEEKRNIYGKPCMFYHLRSRCDNDPCNFSHETLSEGEKLALRHQVRGLPCRDTGDCRDPGCFFRHNCVCQNQRCKHPHVDISTTSIHKVYSY